MLLIAQFLDAQGPLNTLLQNWGWISGPLHFIDNEAAPWVARLTVIIVNMWIGIPVSMLVSMAIIQNLPQDQIEAARIDGANVFQIFHNITFPQILFVMGPSLIQQFIGNINNFNVIFLLTGGKPMNNNYNGAGSTDLLVNWLYNLTFGQQQRYNASAVLGILIFILSATISLIALSFFCLPANAPLRSTICRRRAPCSSQWAACSPGELENTVASSIKPCFRRTHCPSFRSIAGMISILENESSGGKKEWRKADPVYGFQRTKLDNRASPACALFSG